MPTDTAEREKETPDDAPEARRSLRRTLLTAVTAVFVVTGLGAMGYFGWDALTTRGAAEADLEVALDLLRESDAAVLGVDAVVQAESATGVLARDAEEASAVVPGARDALEEALSLVGEAHEHLAPEDRATAGLVRDSVSARLGMLAEASVLLEANIKVGLAVGEAEKGGDLLEEAQDLSNQATEQFNKKTQESVTASTELTDRALGKLEEAEAAFDEVASVFPEVDMSAFVAYADARIAALEKSKSIDEAWLAGRLEESNRLVAEYNEADEAAAALAEALPSSSTLPVAEAFDELTGDAMDRYREAREAAAEADTSLVERLEAQEDAEE